jgi:hypothetical protein
MVGGLRIPPGAPTTPGEGAGAMRTFVIEAELELGDDVHTRAPGGAVTVALCGHWDHEGPCRWPHHSSIESQSSPARLRTVLAVDEPSYDEVVHRVESGLRADARGRARARVRRTIGGRRAASRRLAPERPPVVVRMVAVAQLVRAPGCGPGGRGFESPRSPHARAPGGERVFAFSPRAAPGSGPSR